MILEMARGHIKLKGDTGRCLYSVYKVVCDLCQDKLGWTRPGRCTM
jgi:hypothetical protein